MSYRRWKHKLESSVFYRQKDTPSSCLSSLAQFFAQFLDAYGIMIMFSDPINTQQWSQESLIFGMNLDYTKYTKKGIDQFDCGKVVKTVVFFTFSFTKSHSKCNFKYLIINTISNIGVNVFLESPNSRPAQPTCLSRSV